MQARIDSEIDLAAGSVIKDVMNYRHAYHAGNFSDVVKHAALALILDYLKRKDSAFRVIDTHSGIGVYDLAGEEAQRTGEWHAGIGRLLDADLSPEAATLLAPYLEAVAAVKGLVKPTAYPGSPAIAQHITRDQDRMIFVEKHPRDAQTLKDMMAGDERIKVIELDGWTALKAYIPPPERRGLVLVDPPFEVPDEFEKLAQNVVKAYRKWPTGIYAVWYPLKNKSASDQFRQTMRDSGIPRMLCVELRVREEQDRGLFSGSGLMLINPPFVLAEQMAALLPELLAILKQASGSGWSVTWLTPS